MTTPLPSSLSITTDPASPFTTWVRDRRTMLKAIGIGTVTWPAALGLTWVLWPASAPVSPADRVAYALQLAAAPAILLMLMIASCMRLFDTIGAENPLAGAESPRFRINQRVVTNTLEQAAVFVPLLLALSTRLSDGHLVLLPVAVTVWCAGRLLFWTGYHVAPEWRAPGFDWTMLTTLLLAGWFVYGLL